MLPQVHPCPSGTIGEEIELIREEQCSPCPAGKFCSTAGRSVVSGVCDPGWGLTLYQNLFIKISSLFLNLLLNFIPSYETFFCSFCFIWQFIFWIRFHFHCSDSCVLKVRLCRTLSLTNVLREVSVLLVPLRKLSVLLGPLEQKQVTQTFHSFNRLQLSMI